MSGFFSFPAISLQHEKNLSLFSEKSHHSQLISKESLAADAGYPGGCLSLPPGSIPANKVGFRVGALRDGCRRARSALFQQASCFVGPRATCPLLWAHASDCTQFRKCCKSTLTPPLLMMASALLWSKPTDRHPLGLLKQILKGKANLCCSACPILKRMNWINNK